jgi:hypothetical protein
MPRIVRGCCTRGRSWRSLSRTRAEAARTWSGPGRTSAGWNCAAAWDEASPATRDRDGAPAGGCMNAGRVRVLSHPNQPPRKTAQLPCSVPDGRRRAARRTRSPVVMALIPFHAHVLRRQIPKHGRHLQQHRASGCIHGPAQLPEWRRNTDDLAAGRGSQQREQVDSCTGWWLADLDPCRDCGTPRIQLDRADVRQHGEDNPAPPSRLRSSGCPPRSSSRSSPSPSSGLRWSSPSSVAGSGLAPERAAVRSLVLAVVGVASIVIFWARLPCVLAAGTAGLALDPRRRLGQTPASAGVALALAACTVVAAAWISITG